MLWFIFYPLNLICSIICYLTNWFIVLFADENGELHGTWHLWQTWDDTLDVDWFVKDTVPKIFRYDFDKHYVTFRETTPYLAPYNRFKGAVCQKEGVQWTLKERVQRYICRVLWLTRNNGYGFAFYLFGIDHIGTSLASIKSKYYTIYYNDICWELTVKWWIFRILAGWKLDTSSMEMTRSMIAGRILIRFGGED